MLLPLITLLDKFPTHLICKVRVRVTQGDVSYQMNILIPSLHRYPYLPSPTTHPHDRTCKNSLLLQTLIIIMKNKHWFNLCIYPLCVQPTVLLWRERYIYSTYTRQNRLSGPPLQDIIHKTNNTLNLNYIQHLVHA